MMFPDRFPFDVLDPAPDHCLGCGCPLAETLRTEDCMQADCTCHELLTRADWGDK